MPQDFSRKAEIERLSRERAARFAEDVKALSNPSEGQINELTDAYKSDLKKIAREVRQTVKPLAEMDDNELWEATCESDRKAGYVRGLAAHLQKRGAPGNRK